MTAYLSALRRLLTTAVVLITCTGCHALGPEPVMEWNKTVLVAAEQEDGFMTLKGVRTAAMMHIAMHDALSAIDGTYDAYLLRAKAPGADPLCALTEAAFAVAADQYPDRKNEWVAIRNKWLGERTRSEAMRKGIEIGRKAAQAILADRQDDGWNTEAEYRWHPMGPGVYAEFQAHSGTPEGFVFGAGWAEVRGFTLKAANQFRAPPPPEIASDAYTTAFEEVKQFGRFQSIQRTPDQTHTALWWKDFSESSHNRLARDLTKLEKLPLRDAVRLFALLNMSIFDAYVSSFENKFHYNHWRPYTAIRWAHNDGNEATEAEATWTNTHRHTYPFPSYPSAHGTACASAMTAIEEVFGDDYAFEMRTPMVDVAGPFSGKIEMHPSTRRFDSFDDAAFECGLSRVYLGIHFRYDSEEGVNLGKQVGNNVIQQLQGRPSE